MKNRLWKSQNDASDSRPKFLCEYEKIFEKIVGQKLSPPRSDLWGAVAVFDICICTKKAKMGYTRFWSRIQSFEPIEPKILHKTLCTLKNYCAKYQMLTQIMSKVADFIILQVQDIFRM